MDPMTKLWRTSMVLLVGGLLLRELGKSLRE